MPDFRDLRRVRVLFQQRRNFGLAAMQQIVRAVAAPRRAGHAVNDRRGRAVAAHRIYGYCKSGGHRPSQEAP